MRMLDHLMMIVKKDLEEPPIKYKEILNVQLKNVKNFMVLKAHCINILSSNILNFGLSQVNNKEVMVKKTRAMR